MISCSEDFNRQPMQIMGFYDARQYLIQEVP